MRYNNWASTSRQNPSPAPPPTEAAFSHSLPQSEYCQLPVALAGQWGGTDTLCWCPLNQCLESMPYLAITVALPLSIWIWILWSLGAGISSISDFYNPTQQTILSIIKKREHCLILESNISLQLAYLRKVTECLSLSHVFTHALFHYFSEGKNFTCLFYSLKQRVWLHLFFRRQIYVSWLW